VFNPKPRIERVSWPGGPCCWVVDEVLTDPQAFVDMAVEGRAHFVPAPHNAYPGLEWVMPAAVSEPLSEFFMLHLRAALQARRTLGMYSRLSLATLQPSALRPLQRVCHRDRFGAGPDQSVAACTLYLFRNPELGGTAFYAPRQSVPQTNELIHRWNGMDDDSFTRVIGREKGYITASNRFFDLLGAVPAAFNRAVFYDGSLFHSSHIHAPERLSDDPACGRLTLNGFFICRRNAA
jgi:hypothetical protein